MTKRARPKILFVLPNVTYEKLTETERTALSIRNTASMTGRCACGAVMKETRTRMGTSRVVEMEHESDCPAISAAAMSGARKLELRGG